MFTPENFVQTTTLICSKFQFVFNSLIYNRPTILVGKSPFSEGDEILSTSVECILFTLNSTNLIHTNGTILLK